MAAAALLCGVLPATAEAQVTATPEETARAFFTALDGRRWDEAAGYVLPDAARRQRDLDISMRLARLEQLPKGRGGNFTVSSSGTVDPELLKRFGSTPVRSLRGVSTLAEAAALAPQAYMARMMEMAAKGPPGASMPPTSYVFIAAVVENDSVAHALYRQSAAGRGSTGSEAAEVLMLRRREGRWYVVPGELMFHAMSLFFDDLLERT
jgi:hypothetical protein